MRAFGQVLLPICLLILTPGCREATPRSDADGQPPESQQAVPQRTEGRAYVYACVDAGFRFSVWVEPDSMGLWLPLSFGRPYERLAHVAAASGARYEGNGITVWTHDREAMLEVDDEDFSPCAMDWSASVWEDAKLRGVAFRAVGNEPGWLLEITNGERIRLLLDYGQRNVLLPDPGYETDQENRRTVYHAVTDSNDVTVTIDGTPCADTMSDETFESTVTLDVDGRTYRGCGRALF